MKKHLFLKSLLVLIGVLIVGINQTWANYAYLDLSSTTWWYDNSAAFRLDKNGTGNQDSYTEIPGTGVWRFDIGSYTGNVTFKRMNSDRSTEWNYLNGSISSSQNVAKSTGTNTGSMQTSFVINYIHGTNHVYFDNSVSNFSNNIYLVIGHDYSPTGGSSTYTKAYKMSSVTGTKLFHVEVTDTWQDANFYAIIADDAASISATDWGSSNIGSTDKGDKGYTAAYTTVYNMEGGTFLITTASSGNGKDMTITYYDGYSNLPKADATHQAWVRETGTTYSECTSTYPVSLKLKGSYMKNASDAARSTITRSAYTTDDVNKTYGVIKTGEVTHSYTSLGSSYYFEGWGTGSTPSVTTATHSYTITENTTYKAFISKLYTLTFLPKGTYGTSTVTASVTNYVSVSSGGKAPTGHSITVTATPATGYKLIDTQAWFSDASCTKSLSNGTNTTFTISSLNKDSSVYAKFEPITYSITYNLNGGDELVDPTTSYNITSSTITLPTPTKTNYTFRGWYDNSGFSGDPITSITSGSYGNKEYWAKWEENSFTVTISAGDHGSVSTTSVTGHPLTASSNFTVTANAGYAFSHWTFSAAVADTNFVSMGGTNYATQTFNVTTTAAVTITANYVVRYGLYGSLDADGNPAEGMPGWAVSKDFTYSADTYTCNTESLTKPNSTYKFRILDRRNNFSWGLSSKALIAENTATTLNSGSADAQLATAGRGSYTFTVVEADEGAHPQVTITNPTSYLVHFGTRAFTRDGNADKGGTVTVSDAASDGNTYADGKYIASGETVYVTASDVPTGYNFAGWWDNSSYTGNHFATDNPTNWEVSAAVNAYAKFAAKECTITFDKNGGEGGANGTTGAYDAAMLTITPPHKIGYAFGGYYDAETDNNGSGTKYYNADGTSAKAWNKDTESATTLYAKWTADVKTFKADAASTEWATGSNWAGGAAPTNDYSSVTINGEVVLSTSVHIGELSFGEGGKLTIESTGVLEVAGTITNTDASKIVINTTSSSQGALIYDISTAPYATVNMTIPNTDKFHYIASPVGYVPVDPTFAGKDVYTYAWIEGKGWDKRGFYEGFSGDEVILIKGLSGCTFSGQLRPTTGGSISCTATPANANAQGVNMVPNTLTAPIKIAAMNLSAAYDGAVHIWNGSTWDPYPKSSCGEAVIPALQGYAVLTATGGTVSFTYDAAVRGASSHNDALKAPQRTHSDIQDHITVSVMTNERKENLLLYENNQFSDAIDKGWEALYMEGDGTYGELYAHAKEPMSILATDSLEGTVLGFVPGQAETYTISFEGDGRGYYLNDVKEEEATLIEEGNTYEFAADAATNATRFVISKTPIKKTPTGVDNTNDGVKARKQLIDGTLYIIRDGRLYNTTGALVK